MKKYALVFSVAYLLSTVALSSAADALEFEGSVGFNVAAAVVASLIAAWRFTKDQARVPTAAENSAYARWALAGAWAVSMALVASAVAFMLSPVEAHELTVAVRSMTPFHMGVASGSVVLISAIYYLAIRWPFAWYARRACNA